MLQSTVFDAKTRAAAHFNTSDFNKQYSVPHLRLRPRGPRAGNVSQ